MLLFSSNECEIALGTKQANDHGTHNRQRSRSFDGRTLGLPCESKGSEVLTVLSKQMVRPAHIGINSR